MLDWIQKHRTTNNQFKNFFFKILIAIGLLLIVVQLFQNRGMWGDEAALAINIRDLSFLELFKPLDNGQVAPILYLLLQKGMICVFGSSDLVFRFIPIIATGLAALILFKIIRILEIGKRIALIGISLFLLHPSIIYFSSEVKQYPIDVFAVVLFVFCALKFTKNNYQFKKSLIWILIPIPLFFLSNATVIVLPAIILYLVFNNFIYSKKLNKSLILSTFIWSLSFVIYYLFFVTSNTNKSSMLRYWVGKGLPNQNDTENIFSIIYWSMKIIFKEFFFKLLAFEFVWLSIVYFFIITFGFILILIKRNYELLIIIFVPLLTHLVLSFFSIYPFYERLILYVIPLSIILFCWLWQWYQNASVKSVRNIWATNIIFGCFFLFLVFQDGCRFPSNKDGYRTSIDYLKQLKTNDPIFVFSGVGRIQYYKELSSELDKQIISIGAHVMPKKNDLEIVKKQNFHLNSWLIFSARRSLWKDSILPVLKERGTLEKVLGVNNFFNSKEDYYLYKFHAKK